VFRGGFLHVLDRPLLLVEYMESYPTRWLLAEIAEAYETAVNAGMGFAVSNVPPGVPQAYMEREGIPYTAESFDRIGCPQPIIVLDMRAPRRMEPWEAASSRCIVIGGIMGDHPPRGRGLLLSMRPGVALRNLGGEQMSIHSTAWVTAMLYRGASLDSIRLASPGIIEWETPYGSMTVELPYAYPVDPVEGRPVIPERVRRAIIRGSMWDEEVLHFSF